MNIQHDRHSVPETPLLTGPVTSGKIPRPCCQRLEDGNDKKNCVLGGCTTECLNRSRVLRIGELGAEGSSINIS